jgi:hypothetical protein
MAEIDATSFAEASKIPYKQDLGTLWNKQSNIGTFGQEYARATAAVENRNVEITIDGKSYKADAPKRPTSVKDQAAGGKPPNPDTTPLDPRAEGGKSVNALQQTGSTQAADEGDNKTVSGIASTIDYVLKGAPRVLGGVLPGLEGIMLGLPQAALAGFVKGLPPSLQALAPVGSLVGLIGAVATGGSTSLNNLVKVVAGAAIGGAASQALRSVTGGIGLPAVGGMAGALGSIALSQVINSGTNSIPLNIAIASNPRVTARNTPASSAVLATVASQVGSVAFRSVTQGIPVSSSLLGIATGVALRNVGSQLSIPTPILGVAANFATSALSGIIGQAVGGRIPIIPTNLSLPAVGILSGLSQSIPAAIAQALIPQSVLTSLLPGNLQNQIPRIPPRINSPYVSNAVGVNRGKTQENIPGPSGSGTGGARNPTDEKRIAAQSYAGRVSPAEPISANFTVGSLTSRVILRECQVDGVYDLTSYPLTASEIVKNMKYLAENGLEKIRSQYPGFVITSGWAPWPKPGSVRKKGSLHQQGMAADLQWPSLCGNHAKMAEIAEWCRVHLPGLNQLLLETLSGSGRYWLHVGLTEGCSSPKLVQVMKDHSRFGPPWVKAIP